MKDRKGYVFEGNGKWYARITLTDSTGKRRNIKRTAKSKNDAKEILKQLTRQLEDEGAKVFDALQMTFYDLAAYYELHYAKPAKIVENQKIEGLRALDGVKGYLVFYKEYFGKKKLREITYGDLSAFRSLRLKTPTNRKKPRTIATVNRELAYLRRMFNIAVRQGWIVKNPFNCGEPLILTSCEKRRERILTLDEEMRLLAACDERSITYARYGKEIVATDYIKRRKHLKPFLIALLDTGARKGEMLKLAWHEVSLHNRVITIRAENTKTLRTRQVVITQRLYSELIMLWNESDKRHDSLVFGIVDNVRKSFATACNIAGIKHGGLDGLTLHCLRHTAATRLVKGQLPIQMVGRILGHTQVNTTYRYLTADADTAKQAASILESFQVNGLSESAASTGYVN